MGSARIPAVGHAFKQGEPNSLKLILPLEDSSSETKCGAINPCEHCAHSGGANVAIVKHRWLVDGPLLATPFGTH